MTKLAELTDIPELEGGWINLTEGAELLGYTRSYIYKKASKGGFKTLRKIGNQASYVINISEVKEILETPKVEAKPDKEPAEKKPRAKKEPVETKPEKKAKPPRGDEDVVFSNPVSETELTAKIESNPDIMAALERNATGTATVVEEERELSVEELLSKL